MPTDGRSSGVGQIGRRINKARTVDYHDATITSPKLAADVFAGNRHIQALYIGSGPASNFVGTTNSLALTTSFVTYTDLFHTETGFLPFASRSGTSRGILVIWFNWYGNCANTVSTSPFSPILVNYDSGGGGEVEMRNGILRASIDGTDYNSAFTETGTTLGRTVPVSDLEFHGSGDTNDDFNAGNATWGMGPQFFNATGITNGSNLDLTLTVVMDLREAPVQWSGHFEVAQDAVGFAFLDLGLE